MDATKLAYLKDLGIDGEEALGRFMNNEALMMKFLLRFPQDPNFPKLKAAMEAGDPSAAYTAAHSLKGVTGNLSMKSLFTHASSITEDLRRGDLDAARDKLPALESVYEATVRGLTSL